MDVLYRRALEWLRNEAQFGSEARYAAVVLNEIERLQSRVRELKLSRDDDLRAAHAEGMWQERQKDEYGSY